MGECMARTTYKRKPMNKNRKAPKVKKAKKQFILVRAEFSKLFTILMMIQAWVFTGVSAFLAIKFGIDGTIAGFMCTPSWLILLLQ